MRTDNNIATPSHALIFKTVSKVLDSSAVKNEDNGGDTESEAATEAEVLRA